MNDILLNKAATYDDIYACSDYITLHVPSTPQTKGMINKDTIAMMKDGVILVNMARGAVTDEAAVAAADAEKMVR